MKRFLLALLASTAMASGPVFAAGPGLSGPPAIPQSSLGQPNGAASLGSSGTVPAAQLPIGTTIGTVAPGNLLTALPACTAGSTVAPVSAGQPFQCAGLILFAQ